MKTNMRKGIAVASLAAAVVVGGASAAIARDGNGSIWVGNTYAHISGSIYWWPSGSNHGGMEVSGYLYDDEPDSNSVKVQGKVSGYSYTTLWTNSNGNGTRVWGDKVVYDPAALYVTTGSVQTCRYNSWGTDQCTSEYMTR
ncbi:hypothetical protein [Streptomyces sp. HC307]|uniref:hypothetical protein n=1 Tax=Streptomyces flavusporus TaxID=3385496 RepID=UPI00391702FE